jgi:hypothetical protein
VAPRLGFAYNLFGDDRVKISGSYGRYYDWTKYELARGTFGGDTWTTRYRTLDDPDISKLSRANLTGRNLWTNEPDSYKDSRIPSFGDDVVDPNMKPMAQDAYNLGFEYQVRTNTVVGVNFVYSTLLRTIEDIGTLVNGSEAYIYGNPGEGLAKTAITTGATPPFEMPKAKREYTALEFTANRRFSNSWFLGGSYVLSRLYGNYPGLVNTDEVTAPGRVSVGSQEAFGQRTRPGTNASRAWDLDEMMFDSHGNLGVDGRLPTDRPHVFKTFVAYTFNNQDSFIRLPSGNEFELSGFFTAQSGTPITTRVDLIDNSYIPLFGRGDLGRTEMYSQTDLAATWRYRFGRDNRYSIQANVDVLNAFNQNNVLGVFEAISSHTFDVSDFPGVVIADRQDFDRAFFDGRITAARITSLLDTAEGINTDARYLSPQTFQGPRTVRFGFGFSF